MVKIIIFNKNGKRRKIRENKPTNLKWTEERSMLAFFCFKVGCNSLTQNKIAEKLGIALGAFRSRINEFQIYANQGKTDKVTRMTVSVFNQHNYMTGKDCEHRLSEFLRLEINDSSDKGSAA